MKILVIDDDYLIRYTLARILRSNGYEVITAADGVRGVRAFRDSNPDLVITDMIMPEQEGIETIRQIRSEQPNAKIIAMSGSLPDKDFDLLEAAGHIGADDAIRKPFEPGEMLRRVRELEDMPAHARRVFA